jgi:hypothetical protein
MLDTLNFWFPAREAAITGGQLTGAAAVLDVEGVLASGVRALTPGGRRAKTTLHLVSQGQRACRDRRGDRAGCCAE